MNTIKINYIEFGATDLQMIRHFYETAFGWSFTDYGPEYLAFNDGHLDGGFTTQTIPGGNPLTILYSEDLETILETIRTLGGTITQQIYSFPGGKRFHFTDPSGNELAVWSDK